MRGCAEYLRSVLPVDSAMQAMHFNSIAIGVGSAVMPKVVRHGCALVKYSA
jgi:hypothetical protein